MNAFPLVLSAPSGGGKTTVTKLLMERRARRRLLGVVHDARAARRAR